jgi:hypothetical protein
MAIKRILNDINVKGMHVPDTDYLIYDDERLTQFNMSLDPKVIAMNLNKCRYMVQEH